jgi:hypothetical protein
MEGQAISRSFDSAPCPPSSPPLPSASCFSCSVFLCFLCLLKGKGGRGWARSHNIRPRKKPDPQESFNTLWPKFYRFNLSKCTSPLQEIWDPRAGWYSSKYPPQIIRICFCVHVSADVSWNGGMLLDVTVNVRLN